MFESEDIIYENDGTLVVKMKCPEDDWLYGMILSYAETVEVLEPPHLRDVIKEKLRLAQKIYNGD